MFQKILTDTFSYLLRRLDKNVWFSSGDHSYDLFILYIHEHFTFCQVVVHAPSMQHIEGAGL